MESIVERKTTRWQDRIHRRWFLIYDPIRFYAKERYIIEKIVKAIITVLPMEQKKKGKDGKASFCVCVFVKEGKKERRKKRKRALVRNGLAALEDASSPFLLRLRQENSSLARSQRRKGRKRRKRSYGRMVGKEKKKKQKKRLLLQGR